MPLKIEYNADLQIVESEFWDVVSVKELHQETKETIALAHKHKSYSMLCDASKGKFPMSLANALILEQLNIDLKLPKHAKIAIIAATDKSSHSIGQFYEDLVSNSGWQVRSFKDRKSALEWLQD